MAFAGHASLTIGRTMTIREAHALRHEFFTGLFAGLRVVWPIVSGLLGLMIGLGVLVGLAEGWSLGDSIYFTFVSGLTIGYGDLAPRTGMARVLAIGIGLCGVLLTALLAAIAVRALEVVRAARAE